jgi:hypothetical protein
VDKLRSQLASNSSPSTSGSTPIKVEIFDHAGFQLLSTTTALLSPSLSNPSFTAVFSDGSRIDISFGRIDGKDGTLYMTESGLEAEIQQIRPEYIPKSSANPVQVIAGENARILIRSDLGDITKNSSIILSHIR